MIVWRGWGILTVLIVAAVTVTAVAGGIPVAEALGINTGLALVLGLLLAAVANWFAGRWFNSRPGRELVDARTGERVILRARHDLFFIPMQWWSALVLAAAVVMLISLLVAGDSGAKPGPLK